MDILILDGARYELDWDILRKPPQSLFVPCLDTEFAKNALETELKYHGIQQFVLRTRIEAGVLGIRVWTLENP
jgi:hypothetical protein